MQIFLFSLYIMSIDIDYVNCDSSGKPVDDNGYKELDSLENAAINFSFVSCSEP